MQMLQLDKATRRAWVAATEAGGGAMWSRRVKPGSYLQRGVEDDQFGAGGHGVITRVFLHEVHVDLGSRLLKFVIPTQAEKRGLWGRARPRPVLPQAFELTVPGLWGWKLHAQLQATCAGAHC